VQAPHSPSRTVLDAARPASRSRSSSVVRASASALRRSPLIHISTMPEVK
jgi:hypothetical protein